MHADAWSPGPGGSCAVGERLGVTSRQAAIRPRIAWFLGDGDVFARRGAPKWRLRFDSFLLMLNRKEGSENVWCVSVEEEAKLEPDLASRRS